jgi:hypothetical protein
MAIKYTKLPQIILYGHKIYQIDVPKIDQMALTYTDISISKLSQIYPNWIFWFKNIPSGNPAHDGLNKKRVLFIYCPASLYETSFGTSSSTRTLAHEGT